MVKGILFIILLVIIIGAVILLIAVNFVLSIFRRIRRGGYDDDYDNVNYELTHIDRFIKYLEESIEEDRKTLKQQEDAMTVLNNIYKEGV